MSDDLDELVDELVWNGPGTNDAAVWRRLVTEPGGAARWRNAVARRERALALSRRIEGRPWLARMMLAVRRAGRRFTIPALAPELLSVRLPAFSAMLGPAESNAQNQTIAPIWGHTVTFAVAVGTTVEVAQGAGTVWWSMETGQGALPSRAWTLEPGEAPVVLLVFAGEGEATMNLDELLANRVAAAVMLVEADAEADVEANRET